MTIWHYGRPRIPVSTRRPTGCTPTCHSHYVKTGFLTDGTYRVYERKGSRRLRAYVILAIIIIILLVFSTYQNSSSSASTENQIQSKEYSSILLAPKSRTRSSSSGTSDPQWAEVSETLLIRTLATKAPKKLNNNKLKKNVRDVEVVRHMTKAFKLTKNIKDVVVGHITKNPFKLAIDMSDEEVLSHVTKKGIEWTKEISDDDVVKKNNKKSFELTRDISDADVVRLNTEKDIELKKDVSDVHAVDKNNEKTFVLTKNISDVDFEVVSHESTFEFIKDVRNVDAITSKALHRLPIHLTKNTSHVITKVFNLTKDVRRLCDLPSDGGPISVNTLNISLDDVELKYPEVKFKGRYSPPDCLAWQSVAIIVPYRDRKQNLVTFMNHMHAFLIHQKLDYRIFIVEQKGRQDFNRGKLFNVGFLEAGNWQCFIFHDIDLLPLDQRNFYFCDPLHPRLYDALQMLYGYNLKDQFKGNFGGVAAVTAEQFIKANGYSNGYSSWSGEDNDLYYRLTGSGYTVTQYNVAIARYKAIKHEQKSLNPKRYPQLLQTMKAYHRDGLSTLQYRVLSTTYHHLYTHIVVDVDQSFHDLQGLIQEDRNFKLLHEQFPVIWRHNSPPQKTSTI